MDEYLKLLLEQIRCTKARPYIKQELQDHMEDQIAENMKAGMDHEHGRQCQHPEHQRQRRKLKSNFCRAGNDRARFRLFCGRRPELYSVGEQLE